MTTEILTGAVRVTCTNHNNCAICKHLESGVSFGPELLDTDDIFTNFNDIV